MKLIIAGATGFVAGEVVRQALRMPQMTSIVAISRKAIEPEPQAQGSAAFKNVLIEDYEVYPDEIKKEFAGADACIWTVAITPAKAKEIPFEEVKRVCQDWTLAGLNAIYDSGIAKPFRFIYTSGIAAERDQTKTPPMMAEYALMRGETENQVLAFASAHPGMEACVAKPAIIYAPWKPIQNPDIAAKMGSVEVSEIAAAMLKQTIHGIEKEPLLNDDLVQIGKEELVKN